MNIKARRFRVLPCVVCAYKFADKHHMFPQYRNGGRGPVIPLCPNHHRYATIVQVMVENDMPAQDIYTFAAQHFDESFNTKVLSALISAPAEEVMHNFLNGMFAGIFDEGA